MRRTTVFLPEALVKRARQFATRHGKSLAQVIREAVTAYLTEGGPMTKPSLPAIAGQFASGRSDIAEKASDLLWTKPHE